MASTSAAEPSSATHETPNWLKMPHDIMTMILQRLSAIEILDSAQKVCTTWRRICKDPAMWKVIDMRCSVDAGYRDYDLKNLTKQAVHRSCGELVEISLERFGTDDLLHYISRCSSRLKCLCLVRCHKITTLGLVHSIKMLPHLEALHLFYTYINAEDIEAIGNSRPQLKSFKVANMFFGRHRDCDGYALAIANTMPALRHLQLFDCHMTNDGLEAILHGCPHLESLDLRGCYKLNLGGNLGKLCMSRIKDFKYPQDSIDDGGGFASEILEYEYILDEEVLGYYYADCAEISQDDMD